ARELSFNTLVLTSELDGEAREIARFFAAIAREAASTGNPTPRPACVLAGGETTVTGSGKGSGGRNQEVAVARAIAVAERSAPASCCFASVASDGTDGPTNAAGGLVDPFTCSRATALGITPSAYLGSNDSFHFLAATGDLIVTGPTHTNLMDIQ